MYYYIMRQRCVTMTEYHSIFDLVTNDLSSLILNKECELLSNNEDIMLIRLEAFTQPFNLLDKYNNFALK